MTMPFSRMVDTLSESISKCKDASDPNQKILATEELSIYAGALCAHTARFTRIAWTLTVLILLLAILVFEGVIYFKAIENFLPPEMCRMLEPVYDSFTEDGSILLTGEMKSWLYCILGLAAIPAAFNVILAAVCKHTPVTVERTAAKEKLDISDDNWVWENMTYIEKTLNSVQDELDPGHTISFGAGQALCILFMAPVGIIGFFTGSVGGNLLLLILTGITWFLLSCVPSWLILKLHLRVLTFFFSIRISRKQAKELRDEFLQNKKEYGRQYNNEWRNARNQQGEELYRQATAGGTVDRDLLAQAAEKGSPQANLLIGKRILRRVEEQNLTAREISAVCEEAKEYLRHADRSDTPVGIILYAYTRLQTEGHSEYEWTQILRDVRRVDKAALTEKYRYVYDEVVERLVLKADMARSAVTPSLEAVMRRMEAMEASGGGFGSGWDAMNDDLDAVRHAREVIGRYGEDLRGYDPEGPTSSDPEALGPDPESFPDSNDIW